VELFDLRTDPYELNNLALDQRARRSLEAMNAKLNARLDAEVGEDIGQMLPGNADGAGWQTDARKDL